MTQPNSSANASRFRSLTGFWPIALRVSTMLCVLLSINQMFNLRFLVDYTMLSTQYQYAIVGLLLPFVFIFWPAFLTSPRDKVPWYDLVLFAVALGLSGFYLVNGVRIVDEAWEYAAPDYAVYTSYGLWILTLEAARRAGGWVIFWIIALISIYPMFAESMPGPIAGRQTTSAETAMFHAMSSESIFGLPMSAFVNLVIGFLLFGVALQRTGGGKFFINLAFALLGHVRGGPAKVAIFSSGLMGSMSGSVITNVLTTGTLTIPAMRKVGFTPSYAGGVEACASTGGVLMPPIMGATAFIMATFLEVSYIDVALAAVIPSALYFFGLFMQIDANAARNELAGMPRSELPSLAQVFREGWYFIAVFALLIWMLIAMQREAMAPFYATALLLIINQIFSAERWTRDDLLKFLQDTGMLFAELAAVLAGIGLIIGALAVTGLSGTIANDLIHLAGGSVLALLFMGALTSFILGIGMTVTAAYIFLAIALAPALISGGLSPVAVHLFILYWGMLSYITPPVALGAYAASTVAGAPPMQTGLQAMRLGSVIYIIPFFFVLNPALVMQGEWLDIIKLTIKVLAGIVLIAAALQGYLIGIGRLTSHALAQWPVRILLGFAGIVLALPTGGLIPFGELSLLITAMLSAAVAIGLNRL